MFRPFSHLHRLAASLRKKDDATRAVRARLKEELKEFKKNWAMKFFSPKVTEEPLPSRWFDPKRIKALTKAYEISRNTSRLTTKFDTKDLDDFAKFNTEQFQYYAVGSLV